MIGLPNCYNSENPKALWNEADPREGVSFFAFKQTRKAPSMLGYCPQENGIHVQLVSSLPAQCYSYEYLDSVCVLLKYHENYEKNQAAWEFVGGCFADGEIAKYRPAEVGKSYGFDSVRIEVR